MTTKQSEHPCEASGELKFFLPKSTFQPTKWATLPNKVIIIFIFLIRKVAFSTPISLDKWSGDREGEGGEEGEGDDPSRDISHQG